MSFKDRFYKKVAKDHASRLERALNEESWAVEWFRGLEEIAIWLESIEHLRVSCVDKIIEQKVEKIYSKETNADEISALMGKKLVFVKRGTGRLFAISIQACTTKLKRRVACICFYNQY